MISLAGFPLTPCGKSRFSRASKSGGAEGVAAVGLAGINLAGFLPRYVTSPLSPACSHFAMRGKEYRRSLTEEVFM
jgi:hypothetical protein